MPNAREWIRREMQVEPTTCLMNPSARTMPVWMRSQRRGYAGIASLCRATTAALVRGSGMNAIAENFLAA